MFEEQEKVYGRTQGFILQKSFKNNVMYYYLHYIATTFIFISYYYMYILIIIYNYISIQECNIWQSLIGKATLKKKINLSLTSF